MLLNLSQKRHGECGVRFPLSLTVYDAVILGHIVQFHPGIIYDKHVPYTTLTLMEVMQTCQVDDDYLPFPFLYLPALIYQRHKCIN